MARQRIREALYVNAQGRSQLSGAPLGSTWETDHKVPRAAGGSDDIFNLQALTGDENRAKSMANPPDPRAWQEEFIYAWRRDTSASFLLVALPGAGKTVAALMAAREWIAEHPERRKVVIVVPTDALRNQWQSEAAALFGLQFQTRECDHWKSEMVGFVLTYQGLPGHAPLWQLRCHETDVLVICDEIHHAGDENQWGFHLRECFSAAGRRLVMSGTPFRGDSTRIPFVDYDGEGWCVANYRYDYPRAIRDGVIRVVRFQHERGIVRRLSMTGEENLELSSEVSEAAASEALSRILRPGKYTAELLRLAHAQLLRCRETMPRAGGLAICIDQDHAQRIAQQLKGITGEAPDLVISDGDRATSTVDAFRESNQLWVVAVKQISEGVDIKRLIVEAYLTTAKTPLFFRQAVGRIVRNMGTPEDMEAYCFIPDHPILVQHARQITEAQAQAIEDESDDEFDDAIRRTLWDPPLFSSDIIIGTEHTGTAGTIIEGESLSPATAAEVAALARELVLSEVQALRVYKKYHGQPAAAAPGSGELRSPQRPLEKQMDDARKALDGKVKRIAFRLLKDDPEKFQKLNNYVGRFIGKWDRQLFTLDECRRAIERLDLLKVSDL